MKKIILTAGIISLQTIMVAAQTSAVTNAIFYHKDQELDKAKLEIDKACENEKTMLKDKTWYYKGAIYEDIHKSEKFKNLDPKAALKAYEAYNKAIELDGGKKGEYYKYSTDRLAAFWSVLVNGGIAEYNNANYELAIEMFDLGIKINPKDTTSTFYAAYAAEEMKDIPRAKSYYLKAKENGAKNVDLFMALKYIAFDVEKNNDDAFKYLAEGIKLNPRNKKLIEEEIKLYIATGKQDIAMGNLEGLLQKEPDNAMYAANLAQLHEKTGNFEKSEIFYKKAVEINPENIDYKYNLAALYYNKAVDILKESNEKDFNEYQKVGKKMEADAKGYLSKAIPYFESVFAAAPNDAATIQSLGVCYEKTGEKEKAKEMFDKLDTLQK